MVGEHPLFPMTTDYQEIERAIYISRAQERPSNKTIMHIHTCTCDHIHNTINVLVIGTCTLINILYTIIIIIMHVYNIVLF